MCRTGLPLWRTCCGSLGRSAEALYLERDTAGLGFAGGSEWKRVRGGNQVRSTWNIGGVSSTLFHVEQGLLRLLTLSDNQNHLRGIRQRNRFQPLHFRETAGSGR
jgi:hypothetical protein